MRTLITALALFSVSVAFSGCSKCYTCKQTIDIYDSNGNIIDREIVEDEVCTADKQVIDDRESNGWDCR